MCITLNLDGIQPHYNYGDLKNKTMFEAAKNHARGSPSVLLEAVDLDLLRVHQSNLGKELADVLPLVSLQLEHLSVLSMLHYRTIAGKLLLTGTNNLLQVILC